jgi:hypothetical protein
MLTQAQCIVLTSYWGLARMRGRLRCHRASIYSVPQQQLPVASVCCQLKSSRSVTSRTATRRAKKSLEKGVKRHEPKSSPHPELNRRPLPYKGSALPLSYMGHHLPLIAWIGNLVTTCASLRRAHAERARATDVRMVRSAYFHWSKPQGQNCCPFYAAAAPSRTARAPTAVQAAPPPQSAAIRGICAAQLVCRNKLKRSQRVLCIGADDLANKVGTHTGVAVVSYIIKYKDDDTCTDTMQLTIKHCTPNLD